MNELCGDAVFVFTLPVRGCARCCSLLSLPSTFIALPTMESRPGFVVTDRLEAAAGSPLSSSPRHLRPRHCEALENRMPIDSLRGSVRVMGDGTSAVLSRLAPATLAATGHLVIYPESNPSGNSAYSCLRAPACCTPIAYRRTALPPRAVALLSHSVPPGRALIPHRRTALLLSISLLPSLPRAISPLSHSVPPRRALAARGCTALPRRATAPRPRRAAP